MYLSTFWDVMGAAFIIFFVLVPLVLMWVYALADLFKRRDIRWRKLVWLLAIILLPFFGPLIYLMVRPEEEIEAAARLQSAGSDVSMGEHYRTS